MNFAVRLSSCSRVRHRLQTKLGIRKGALSQAVCSEKPLARTEDGNTRSSTGDEAAENRAARLAPRSCAEAEPRHPRRFSLTDLETRAIERNRHVRPFQNRLSQAISAPFHLEMQPAPDRGENSYKPRGAQGQIGHYHGRRIIGRAVAIAYARKGAGRASPLNSRRRS
jgi:hypothetical protein